LPPAPARYKLRKTNSQHLQCVARPDSACLEQSSTYSSIFARMVRLSVLSTFFPIWNHFLKHFHLIKPGLVVRSCRRPSRPALSQSTVYRFRPPLLPVGQMLYNVFALVLKRINTYASTLEALWAVRDIILPGWAMLFLLHADPQIIIIIPLHVSILRQPKQSRPSVLGKDYAP
jgi:hypothetical protein